MRTLLLGIMILSLVGAAAAQPSSAQQQSKTESAANPESLKVSASGVVMSGIATTARIADPNEPVVFSGRVMRMADFVAAVSSSTAAVQHPRNQEMRSREKDQPAQQSQPSDLK